MRDFSAPRHANFYPRPPRGGRRLSAAKAHLRRKFLSTPSARRATGPFRRPFSTPGISIHALREEGDMFLLPMKSLPGLFLSTPSARRATHAGVVNDRIHDISIHALREEGDTGSRLFPGQTYYFYPRPPRGGRPAFRDSLTITKKISIHALREEGDMLQDM